MIRSLTCIICPNGCEVTVDWEGNQVRSIRGALCPKGEDYVHQELTNPRRSIATSVPVEGGTLPLVSVRLNRPIPKGEIFPVMEAINGLRLQAPTVIGQVALANVRDLGADVIVTKNVERA